MFRSPLIRSTMVLDFLVTFFASATALLPIYAQDILRVGPRLRLAVRRSFNGRTGDERGARAADRQHRRRGAVIWSVVGHGIVTIMFGVSNPVLARVRCPRSSVPPTPSAW